MQELTTKYQNLQRQLQTLGRCGIAFSGGVDSSLLLQAAVATLGTEQVIAVTADAPMHLRAELADATVLAARLGVQQIVIPLTLDDLPELADNAPDRCYRCKRAILSRFRKLLPSGFLLCEGSNADDLASHRPGWRAVQELQVVSPLVEAGLSKPEIRELSRRFELPTADKPAQSCLLTRFPHHVALHASDLLRVETSEERILRMGYSMLRVRSIGAIARLEFQPGELARARLPEQWQQIQQICLEAGFQRVELDQQGYRSGSMD